MGNIYGLLYIYESRTKPLFAARMRGKELKGGRYILCYRANATAIKYPELRIILDARP
jgi:hypothetical protein